MSVDVSYGSDTITYYLSRDSAHGKLEPVVNMWWKRPLRLQKAGHVIWVAGNESESGHFGEYEVKQILAWFRVFPETDRELVVAEQFVPKDTPEGATDKVSAPKIKVRARG